MRLILIVVLGWLTTHIKAELLDGLYFLVLQIFFVETDGIAHGLGEFELFLKTAVIKQSFFIQLKPQK